MAKRWGYRLWDAAADRRFFGDEHWSKPLWWNQAAVRAGRRARAFCASMADVFEDRRDLGPARARLWDLIASTPVLDWQLLTKRPHMIARLSPWGADWPANVWIGTTVEDQRRAEERLPFLTALPAAVRFVSAEPLLGQLALERWLPSLDWVIAGGESGHGARPTPPSWFANLRDQCVVADVAFFFKQWGSWGPHPGVGPRKARCCETRDGAAMYNVGKKAAGRRLDAREWSEFPDLRVA